MSRGKIDPRLAELLADDALFGLTDSERRELQAQTTGHDTSFEIAAAAVELASLPVEPMPAHLAVKIESTMATQQAPAVIRSVRAQATLPWLAAAACALLALGGWSAYWTKPAAVRVVETSPPPPPVAPPSTSAPAASPQTQREELLRSAKDAVTLEWSATKDPAGRAVQGDVVWSEGEQRGFLRFRGLPVNDPTKSQYQLWVFDRTQDHPIDGGVFDVAPTGETVLAIAAKLRVVEPTLFAVTVEKPGGVVVSKRQHIVATAAVKAG